MSLIHVGCCGFQKSHAVYYQNFDLIEIQSTFYRLPMLKTAERWRMEAPEHFRFTLKTWQLITHEPYSPTYRRSGMQIPINEWKRYGSFRPTDEVMDAWECTREIAMALKAPVVVFQCPPQFTPTRIHLADMRQFFQRIRRGPFLCAWEPRGEWPKETIQEICAELDLLHCVDPFTALSVYGIPAYFRMHGGVDYSYKFKDADLAQLRALCEDLPEAYCLFNNVEMWDDALRFRKLVDRTPDEVPQKLP